MFWLNDRQLLYKLVDNWPAKVLSVALALILVVFYRVSTLSTRTITVPLAVETSHALIPASPVPGNVRVTLRGDDDSVRSIAESDIQAFVDLSRHESEGTYSSPIQIRRLGAALEVEPLEISVRPLEISVRLDRRISMVLPLVAPVQGSVASGFDLVSHSMSPAEIYVSGPLSILGDLSQIATSPVNLEGRSGDFTVTVSVVNPNPLLSLRHGSAEFQGSVRPAVPVRTIENIPITVTGLPPGFVAEWNGRPGSVRLEGSWAQIDAFTPAPGFLSVDASGITEAGSHVLPVAVDLPAGFLLIRQEPESLTIELHYEEYGGENGYPAGYGAAPEGGGLP